MRHPRELPVNDSDRQSFFASLSELVETQEGLISQHPPETSGLYFGGKVGLLDQLSENPPMRGDLQPHEFMTVLRYLLCSSFIAAWADLHEPDFDPKKAAIACMMPLSCMSDEFRSTSLDLHLHMQKLWRKGFGQSSAMSTARGDNKKWWQFWK
jgi:hypothetical protein